MVALASYAHPHWNELLPTDPGNDETVHFRANRRGQNRRTVEPRINARLGECLAPLDCVDPSQNHHGQARIWQGLASA